MSFFKINKDKKDKKSSENRKIDNKKIKERNVKRKNKEKKNNIKNLSYIPIKFKENYIATKTDLSKIAELKDLKEIKNLLEITDYRNRYKLLIDIKEGDEPIYYLQETVRSEKGEKLEETEKKFKLDGQIKAEKIIEMLRDIYRNDFIQNINKINAKKEIAPYTIKIKEDHFINDKYAGTVNGVEKCNDEFFIIENIFNNIKGRVIISIDFKRVNDDKILQYLSEKNQDYSKYSIPDEVKNSIPMVIEKLENSVYKKIGIILYSISVLQLAKDEEELKVFNEELVKTLKENGLKTIILNNNQRNALNYTLPYGIDNTDIKLAIEKDKFLSMLFRE